jgi:hypothetical protein
MENGETPGISRNECSSLVRGIFIILLWPAEAACGKLPSVSSETALSISIVDSRTKGIPTAVVRRADGQEFFLHSRENPLEEARMMIREKPIKERTLYVVLGFGLGYHIRELLEKIPESSHVAVIEPDFACLSSGLLRDGGKRFSDWMQDSRLHCLVYHDPAAVPMYLADQIAKLRLLALEMITHQPSTLTAESFYGALLEEIPKKFPDCLQSHFNYADRMMEGGLANLWANLPYSWNAAPIKNLAGKWAGRMLIIASAGPSLADALPILSRARGNALLLATGTASRVLTEHQAAPDLILSIDPYEANLAHFSGWDLSGLPLVYYHRIHHGILPLCAGPKCFFVMQDEPPIPLTGAGEKSQFWRGGSVAFSALQLAHYLEANPILFVGQDFAFPGGHTHCTGCINDQAYAVEALPEGYYPVPGINGAPVLTDRIFHTYLLFMQDYLLKYSRQKPKVRHINTSRIGARIQGMENISIEEMLASGKSPATKAPREVIAAALRQTGRIPQGARRGALNRWTSELDALLARSAELDNFANLYSEFRSTSIYAQAAPSYDDIFYLYETRYQAAGDAPSNFRSRFEAHLQFVLQTLRAIQAAG